MSSTDLKRALECADPRFADVLRRLGHKVEEAAPPAEPDEAEAEEQTAKVSKTATKKRAYKRRDMKAGE